MPSFFEEPLNKIINSTKFEIHLPGYRYCGVGTKLNERFARLEQPINGLDRACLEHDLAYLRHQNLKQRHQADKRLEERAIGRAIDKGASWCEKANAMVVGTAMSVKRKLGLGVRTKKRKKTRRLKTIKKVGGRLSRSRKYLLNSFARVAAGPKRRRKMGGKQSFLRAKGPRALNY